jgi:hypothetical protein
LAVSLNPLQSSSFIILPFAFCLHGGAPHTALPKSSGRLLQNNTLSAILLPWQR